MIRNTLALFAILVATLLYGQETPPVSVNDNAPIPMEAEQEVIVVQESEKLTVGDPTVNDPVSLAEVEVLPEFPGGEKEMFTFLIKETRYPKEAMDHNIQGKVYVEFVVDKDGKLTDVRVKRGANEYLDNEAVRVISSMPNWKPGMQDGKAVKVRYILPINFVLHDGAKKTRQHKGK